MKIRRILASFAALAFAACSTTGRHGGGGSDSDSVNGTPLGTALRVQAQENRDMRIAEAERKAAALPPRLTVPMMLFFMPVIFVVILGPVVMTISKFF